MCNKIRAVFLFLLAGLAYDASPAEDVVYVSYWAGGWASYNVGYIDQWGQWTLISNGWGHPPSISWSVDGHLYWDDGSYISQIGPNGAQTQVLSVPRSLPGYDQWLAATPDGRLYYYVILGGTSEALYLARTDGNVSTVSTDGLWAMAAGPDNNLYAVVWGDGPNLSVLSPAGKVTMLISNLWEVVGSDYGPGGMTVDKNGAIYLGTRTSIFRIDQSGSASVYATGFQSAREMTIDSKGNLYVVDGEAQLYRVDTNGQISVLSSNLPNVLSISFLTTGPDPRGGNYLAPPFVTSQPLSQIGYWGKSVSFSARFGGAAPLAFQWIKDGAPIANATNTTLVLSDLKLADSGNYGLTATNVAGATTTKNATLTVNSAGVSLGLYPGVLIDGVIGRTYGVFYCTNLAKNSWLPLTNITLGTSCQLWLDASANTSDPACPRRFYMIQPVGP